MRIEICGGTINSSLTTLDFQNSLSTTISDAESLISCFKDIKNNTYNLSGGVDSLQSALDDIDQRIQVENARIRSAESIQDKANDFFELAKRVDTDVSKAVDQNKDELYRIAQNKGYYLYQNSSNDDRAWYEKAWDWLCGTAESVGNAIDSAWNWTKDTLKKAWDGLVDFWDKNKLEIINWGVTALCVIGSIAAIALIPVTGGASIALIAVVSALSGAIIAGTRNATSQYAENGSFDNFDWGSFAKDILIAAAVGGITGAVGAGISGALTSSLSNTALGATLLNNSNTITRVIAGATIGSISEVGTGVATRGIASAGESFLKTGTIDYDAVVKSSFDPSSMWFDFALGSVTGGYAAKRNPMGKEITLEMIDDDILDSKPSHSPNPKKWLQNDNNKIFVDGNGTWTYLTSDGTHVCYSDGFPDFKRAGLVQSEYGVSSGFDTSNHSNDINEAIRNTGLGGKGSNVTWHHNQNGTTLQLVDTKYHQLFTHRGGFAVAKGG